MKEAKRIPFLEAIVNSHKEGQYCRTNGCYRDRFETCGYCFEHGKFVNADRDPSWIELGSYVKTDRYGFAKVVSVNYIQVVNYRSSHNGGAIEWTEISVSVRRDECVLLKQVEL